MKTTLFLATGLFLTALLPARTLRVGGGDYPDFETAAAAARPGDTLFFPAGVYGGDQYIDELQGRPDAWITVLADPAGPVVIRGGAEAWHFTDAAFVLIRGFIFEGQRQNGVNIDDGDSYDTPSHHLRIEDCIFRDMAGDGNNDLLKLSGVDDFAVDNCRFANGAGGGSGIDMVGCHRGLIRGCRFEDLGASGVQIKGGSRYVRVEANVFLRAGERACNLGGSTSLPFFRPADAPFEAADLQVYANFFAGSRSPVAFVGCLRAEVVNNTFYQPERWVLRILQENVDPNRFLACADNTFRNNIAVADGRLARAANVGPNTRPETFTFSHNLWFRPGEAGWQPELPVAESGGVTGRDPQLRDPAAADVHLLPGSPALGAGEPVAEPERDLYGIPYGSPRAIGAAAGHDMPTSRPSLLLTGRWRLYPVPARDWLHLYSDVPMPKGILRITDLSGRVRKQVQVHEPRFPALVTIPVGDLPPGYYLLHAGEDVLPFVRQGE